MPLTIDDLEDLNAAQVKPSAAKQVLSIDDLEDLNAPTQDQRVRANVLSRLGYGAMEPMIGAGQLVARGIDHYADTNLSESVDDYWKKEKSLQDEAAKATGVGFDAAGLVGNILSPVNAIIASKIPAAASFADKILQGIKTGAKVGAVMPQYGDDFVKDKSLQVAENAAVGGSIPVIGEAAKKAIGGVADIIGGIGTHTGGEGIKKAAEAGFEGGKKAETFIDNIRENVPKTDILDAAKRNLQKLASNRADDYRRDMAAVSGDQSILSFNGIDNAVKNAFDTVTFKGQVKNKKGYEIAQKIEAEIQNWKLLNPSQFHTPEGLDALKQKISGIQESIPYEERTARMVAGNIYNSIKSEIAQQAPVYNKVMKDYSQASELINEIERSFSLKKGTSADTAMRKLQSLMRNNVNTNYGNRLDLAGRLEAEGGEDILTGLAGQSLSILSPRGIGGIVAGATGIGGLAMSNPLAIPLLGLQSPRLVGETAYYGGKTIKGLSKIPQKTMITNYLAERMMR